jgi:hypothetical protein
LIQFDEQQLLGILIPCVEQQLLDIFSGVGTTQKIL